MNQPLRVLFVEDSEQDVLLVTEVLRRGGFLPVFRQVETAEEMARALREEPWDIVISDNNMPRFDGQGALAVLKGSGLDLPFLLVSGSIGEKAAVAIMKAGAHDFIMKDSLARLAPAVERELREALVRAERRRAEENLRKANEQLESRVADRTARLSEANRILEAEIVERKKAEEERDRMGAQLLQGQKLQAIGQLAAGVAHEINNPLGYILSNLHTLREYHQELAALLKAPALTAGEEGGRGAVGSNFREKRKDTDFLVEDFGNALEECVRGGERIRDIVKSLREFAHPDEGVPQPVDLRTVLDSAIHLCWNQIKYKATLHRDYGEIPPLLCRPQQIEQVFVNLLVNAAQAIEEKGEIRVSTRLENGTVAIRVCDNGSGILPEHKDKIFEPFFTTKPVGKGTGLGLHMAYKIIKAHRGEMEVTSEAGQGTQFTVSLPVSSV